MSVNVFCATALSSMRYSTKRTLPETLEGALHGQGQIIFVDVGSTVPYDYIIMCLENECELSSCNIELVVVFSRKCNILVCNLRIK